MDKKNPKYVIKRTKFGSGPHKNKPLDVKKGLVRKTKHKKKDDGA